MIIVFQTCFVPALMRKLLVFPYYTQSHKLETYVLTLTKYISIPTIKEKQNHKMFKIMYGSYDTLYRCYTYYNDFLTGAFLPPMEI